MSRGGYDANRYRTDVDAGPQEDLRDQVQWHHANPQPDYGVYQDPGADIFPLMAGIQSKTACCDDSDQECDAEKTPRPPRALFSKPICKRSRQECPRVIPPSLQVVSSQEPMPPTLDTRWPGNRNVHRFLIHAGAGLPNDQSNPMAEIANADPAFAAPLESNRPMAEISQYDDPWQTRDKFEDKVPFDTITNALGETVLCFQEAEPFPPTTTKGAIYFPERLALPNPKLAAAQGYDVHAPIRHKKEQYKDRPVREKTDDEMYREIREELHYRTNQDIMLNRNGDLPFQQLSEGKPLRYDVTFQAAVQKMQQTLPPTNRDEEETPYVGHGDAQYFAGLPQVQNIDRCLMEQSHYTSGRHNIANIELEAGDRQLPSAYGARFFPRSMDTRTPLRATQRDTTSLAGPYYGPADASYMQLSARGTTDRDNTPSTPEYRGTDQHTLGGAQWQYGQGQVAQAHSQTPLTDRGIADQYYTSGGQSVFQAQPLQSVVADPLSDRGTMDQYRTASGQSLVYAQPMQSLAGDAQQSDRGLDAQYVSGQMWNPSMQAPSLQAYSDPLNAHRGQTSEQYIAPSVYPYAQAPLQSMAAGLPTNRGANEGYYTVSGEVHAMQGTVYATGMLPTDRGHQPYYTAQPGQLAELAPLQVHSAPRPTDREWQQGMGSVSLPYDAQPLQALGGRQNAQTGLAEQEVYGSVAGPLLGPVQSSQQRHSGQSGVQQANPFAYSALGPENGQWNMPSAYASAFHPNRRTGLQEQQVYGDVAMPYAAPLQTTAISQTDRGYTQQAQWPISAPGPLAAPVQSLMPGRQTGRDLEAHPYYGVSVGPDAQAAYSTTGRQTSSTGTGEHWIAPAAWYGDAQPMQGLNSHAETDRGAAAQAYSVAAAQQGAQQQFQALTPLRSTQFSEPQTGDFGAAAFYQGLPAGTVQGAYTAHLPYGGAAENQQLLNREGPEQMPIRQQGIAGLVRETQKDFGESLQLGNASWQGAQQSFQSLNELRPTHTGAQEDTYAGYSTALGSGAQSLANVGTVEARYDERGPPARADYADTVLPQVHCAQPTPGTERGPLLAYNVPAQTERSSTDPDRLAYFGGLQPAVNSIRPRDSITVSTRTDNRGYRDVWDYRDLQKVRDGQETSCTAAYIGTWGNQTGRANNDTHAMRDPYSGFHVSDRMDMRRSDYYTGGSAAIGGNAQADPRTVRSVPPSPVMTFGAVRAKEGLYGLD